LNDGKGIDDGDGEVGESDAMWSVGARVAQCRVRVISHHL